MRAAGIAATRASSISQSGVRGGDFFRSRKPLFCRHQPCYILQQTYCFDPARSRNHRKPDCPTCMHGCRHGYGPVALTTPLLACCSPTIRAQPCRFPSMILYRRPIDRCCYISPALIVADKRRSLLFLLARSLVELELSYSRQKTQDEEGDVDGLCYAMKRGGGCVGAVRGVIGKLVERNKIYKEARRLSDRCTCDSSRWIGRWRNESDPRSLGVLVAHVAKRVASVHASDIL